MNIEGLHYKTGKFVRIEIINGFIESIQEILRNGNGIPDWYVAPGLIDNQINGYAGVDFSGNDLSSGAFINASKEIFKTGVTSFLPAILTNSHENLLKIFTILGDLLKTEKSLGECIPGFHLEGPYISPEEGYRGCHPLHHIRKPSWKEFMAYQNAADGKIIQVTIAPEIEGALEFIKLCVKEKIIVAIGHTNASSDQISEAVDSGAGLSTHLGNGCANFIHRHKNPIWPQLSNDKLVISVIADGHHLLPEELHVFYKVKGREKIILTSDVTYLAGMVAGKYTFLESEVILTEDGLLLNPELNCLAGASFPLKKGVETMMNISGCGLKEAIDMASGNVARIYNLEDRGELAAGKRADIVLFKKAGNHLKLINTYLNGVLV